MTMQMNERGVLPHDLKVNVTVSLGMTSWTTDRLIVSETEQSILETADLTEPEATQRLHEEIGDVLAETMKRFNADLSRLCRASVRKRTEFEQRERGVHPDQVPAAEVSVD